MMTSLHPLLPRRIVRKIKKVVRQLSPVEREFGRVWPLIDAIPGWLFGGQEKWLFKAARALPDAANIVEVGSYKGRSTCSLAFGCRRSRKRVYAVDSFDGNDWDFPERDFFQEFWANVERCGLSNCVEPVVSRSLDAAKVWKKPIHLLFIDGSHRYEDVLADFFGFLPHVVPRGIIAFHDVDETWPGVVKAWEEIRHQLTDTGLCSTLGYGRKSKERK